MESKDRPDVVLVLGTELRAQHAVTVLQRQGATVAGLLSEEPYPSGATIGELPVLGLCTLDEIETQWLDQGLSFFVAVSTERFYTELCRELRKYLCNAIDPSAVVANGLQIGRNVLVEAGAVLGPSLKIDDGCWIQPHARLAAGVRLQSRAIVGGGATLSAEVEIGAAAHVGAQSYLSAGLQIGKGAQIAPLSLVLEDVADAARTKGTSKQLS